MRNSELLACVASLCLSGAQSREQMGALTHATPQVGTYDSRAIAVAFVGSPVYKVADGNPKAHDHFSRTNCSDSLNSSGVTSGEGSNTLITSSAP